MQGNLQSESVIFFKTSHFARAMLNWFYRHRRDLPWRVPMKASRGERPDPYYVLVSEAMLQQTQVATVIPYFQRFIERFPAIRVLAESDEQEVLRLWQGLGYYSRARNLRKAAQMIVREFGSQIPHEVKQLESLPGIGKYSAGAIGSIAYGGRCPIVDGNVARVLCRIFAIKDDPREKATKAILWTLAEQILPEKHCGDFNQSLMELGATVCVSRNPSCLLCPVRQFCRAFDAGVQNDIPPLKKSQPKPLEHRWTFVIQDESGHVLIEQRPPTGRWAGMWQFVTLVASDTESPRVALARLPIRIKNKTLHQLGEVRHQLTHRSYRFNAFLVNARHAKLPSRTWVTMQELTKYPMSKPQLKIAALAMDR